MAPKNQGFHKQAVREGLGAAWPICLGYLPIGAALGVLAQKAGLSPLEVGLMSILVFAGSAQFICVSMLSGGAAFLPIIMTTFVVNLRHILMSASLARFLGPLGRPGLALYAYGVTDESFGVNYTRFIQGGWSPGRALLVNHAANAVWIMCTVGGAYFGELIPEGAFGMDYALNAMFIGLLVFQVRGLVYAAAAVFAGASAAVMSFFVEGNMHVIAGAVCGASAAYFLRKTKLFRHWEAKEGGGS